MKEIFSFNHRALALKAADFFNIFSFKSVVLATHLNISVNCTLAGCSLHYYSNYILDALVAIERLMSAPRKIRKVKRIEKETGNHAGRIKYKYGTDFF